MPDYLVCIYHDDGTLLHACIHTAQNGWEAMRERIEDGGLHPNPEYGSMFVTALAWPVQVSPATKFVSHGRGSAMVAQTYFNEKSNTLHLIEINGTGE